MKVALHGLIVESDLAIAAPLADGPADVTIESSTQPFGREAPPGELLAGDADGRLAALIRTDEGLIIHVPGICRFAIDASLSRVRCIIESEADPGMAAILAAGNLIATLLGLRGIGVLHASAVAFSDDSALAVAGPSGMGKSTIAALLCDAGARLLSDDVLRLDERMRCFPGATQIRLRESAAALAGPAGDAMTTPDRRVIAAPPVAPDPVPLTAVLLPRPSRDHAAVQLRRVPGAEAAAELLRCARIFGWRHPDALKAQFELAARVARTTPVFEGFIPWGPPFAGPIAEELRSALA